MKWLFITRIAEKAANLE